MAQKRLVLVFRMTCCVLLSVTCVALSEQQGYTFRQPGQSYVEYQPAWKHYSSIELVFSFRTLMRSTFLAHHTLLGAADGIRPHIWMRLKEGQLMVSHELDEMEETITIGRGLNHNQWHEVHVSLDMTFANLSVTLDGAIFKTAVIRSLLADLDEIIPTNDRSGIFSIGGFSRESLQRPSLFIGCMKNVRFIEVGQELVSDVSGKSDVERGCVDHCETDNPCTHHGRCVNLYTRTICDCYNTGYEGIHCQREGLTAITLQGSEWVSYIQPDRDARTHKPTNKVAFHFKTSVGEGILFYAREQYPHYNHLAASLSNASLHISVVFVDQVTYNELFVSMGVSLNDSRWHTVSIVHVNQEVLVQLDSELERMTTDHPNPHLRFPTAVYFGGTEVTSRALGLKSHVGFVGCLRSLYVDSVSVLERLGDEESPSSLHGANAVRYGCQSLNNATLQFTHDGAFTRVDHSRSRSLGLELEFRTLKGNGVLVSTEITSDLSVGYIQILLRKGKLVVELDQFTSSSMTSGATKNLNDNKWHYVKVLYRYRSITVYADHHVPIHYNQHHDLSVGEASYVGFGPNTAMEYGFVGCMKSINIQGVQPDAVQVVHSSLSAGVTLGNCDLVDWCAKTRVKTCHHNGTCVSLWSEAHCDCSDTDYMGKSCQFSELKQSCSELYHSGVRVDGVYKLDVDGAGPLLPVLLHCDMQAVYQGVNITAVTVQHNLLPNTPVRHPSLKDMKKIITYRGVSTEHLRALVTRANSCRQHYVISCQDAALLSGKEGLFSSGSGIRHISMSPQTMQCQCGQEQTCHQSRLQCNCQEKVGDWREDNGYLVNKSQLPVTEMSFTQKNGGSANMSLGPLICFGDEALREETIVMFSREDSYLELPGWEGGPLSFMFRSTSSTAYLVYQAESAVYRPHGGVQLMITMHSNRLLTIQMSRPQLIKTVRVREPLNTGAWQYFSMEILLGQLHVRVNGEDFILDAVGADGPGQQATSLYVGGKPRIGNSFSGIKGCFGGLYYNGKSHALAKMVKKGSDGVLARCVASCDENQCVNDAQCLEQWSGHTCQCVNPFSQSGLNCQHDINTDVVTLHSESSFIEFLTHSFSRSTVDFFTSDVILSFRSSRSSGLLLYAHDHLNNHLFVHVSGRQQLAVGFNTDSHVHVINVTVEGLTDGAWKQLALVQSTEGRLTLHVDSSSYVLPWRRVSASTPVPAPIHRGDNSLVPEGAVRLFIGGLSTPYLPSYQGLRGCVRGLKIGNVIFKLTTDPAMQASQEVTVGCSSPCLSSPCHNGGWCVDDDEGHYNCECSDTKYSGPKCDKELGLHFDGETFVFEHLRTRGITSANAHDFHLKFYVSTNSLPDSPVALVLLIGRSRDNDYALVWMTERGIIAANIGIDGELVTLAPSIRYVDDQMHRVALSIVGNKAVLKTDDYMTERTLPRSSRFDPPEFLILGGTWTYSFLNMEKFTGDISNVFLLSDYLVPVNARPIDVYYKYPDGNNGITVVGQIGPSTHKIHSGAQYRRGHRSSMTSETPLTMPPWDQGPAETVPLGRTTSNPDDDGSSSVGLIIGIVVVVVVLLCIAVVLLVIILKNKYKSGTFTPVPPAGDEEEGLLRPGSLVPSEKSDKGKSEDIPTAKLRQGPKSKKRSPKEGELSDDNEESPMLRESDARPESSDPPAEEINLHPFGETLSSSMPMIDEVGNEYHNDPEKNKKPDQHVKPNRPSSTELKRELHIPKAVFDPSPGNTSTPYKKDNVAMRKSKGRNSSPPRSRPTSLPLAVTPTGSISNLHSEVWTESQILDVIENDQIDEEPNAEPVKPSTGRGNEDQATLPVRGTQAGCTHGAGNCDPLPDSTMETYNTAQEKPSQSSRDSDFASLTGSLSPNTLKTSGIDENRSSPVKNGSLKRGSNSASASPSLHLKRGSRMRDPVKDDDSEPDDEAFKTPIRVTADVHSPSSESSSNHSDLAVNGGLVNGLNKDSSL